MNTNNYQRVENFLNDETRSLLDQDCAGFFFDQAEKCLTDTIQTSMRITDRSYVFAGMMLTVFIALFSGIVNTSPLELQGWWSVVFCVLGCCFCAASLTVLLTKVMTPYSCYARGKSPSAFKIEEWLTYYHQTSQPAFENIIADELCALEERIQYNTKSNEARIGHLRVAIKIVLYGVCTASITLLANIATIIIW